MENERYQVRDKMIDIKEPGVLFIIVMVLLIFGGFVSLMFMPDDGDNWRNELKKEGTKYCTECHKEHKF
jgi:hypothetical protein